MKFNTTKNKIMNLLFDYPTRRFHIREISRILHVSAPAVSKAVKELSREKLLNYRLDFISEITADINENFKDLKRINNLQKIYFSGLLKYLDELFPLATIILFGSYSKGEDIEQSDIDIAILWKDKKLSLNSLEKKFNRKINVQFCVIRKISEEFKEALINGIVLHGSINIKDL